METIVGAEEDDGPIDAEIGRAAVQHRTGLDETEPSCFAFGHGIGPIAEPHRLDIAGAREQMPRIQLRAVVEFHTETGLLGHRQIAVDDLVGLLGDALAVLPDPVGVDGGDVAGCGGGAMR